MLSKLPYLLVIALLAMAPIACSGPEEDGTEDVGGTTVPDWFVNVPSQPGEAFYGVGVHFYQSTAAMQLAMQQADLAARRQIADTMQVTIQAATRNYMEQVMTQEGEVVEQSFAENVARSITNVQLSGTVIVKRETIPDSRSGLTNVFSLARIGFDNVADNMRNELQRRVAQVKEDAEQAFDNLDALIEQDNMRNIPPAIQSAQEADAAANPDREPLNYRDGMNDPKDEAAQ